MNMRSRSLSQMGLWQSSKPSETKTALSLQSQRAIRNIHTVSLSILHCVLCGEQTASFHC